MTWNKAVLFRAGPNREPFKLLNDLTVQNQSITRVSKTFSRYVYILHGINNYLCKPIWFQCQEPIAYYVLCVSDLHGTTKSYYLYRPVLWRRYSWLSYLRLFYLFALRTQRFLNLTGKCKQMNRSERMLYNTWTRTLLTSAMKLLTPNYFSGGPREYTWKVN